MWPPLRRWLVGMPLMTAQALHERLSRPIAMAVLSSDAMSSVAYATEEILLVLAAAALASQGGSFHYLIPISLAIGGLLWVVILSYRQTIFAYPSGGGAYIVAKDNLGSIPSLTAGAALLVDYTLTVSVSVAAGVAAVTSAVQGTSLAWLAQHPGALCVAAIAALAVLNLRGLRQSGTVIAVPVYLFIGSFLGLIAFGLIRYFASGDKLTVPIGGTLKYAEGYAAQNLSLFLLLAAFSSGCTAMTGVEAISNGVPAFRPPESRNAAKTLVWMACILTTLFLGMSTLAYLYGVQPIREETVVSQFARVVFSGSLTWAYFLVQGATAVMLVLAANTSFADFPRLASLMARDRYLPRQFVNLGDRLVFSNGIMALALLAGLLVWVFEGDVTRLIPLYAIGVFLSFTLSQAGMVRHWWRVGRERANKEGSQPSGAATASTPTASATGWRRALAINAVGAVVTAMVLCVFVLTKFVHGAWIVVVVIPVLVLVFHGIGRHYRHIEEQLRLSEGKPKMLCYPNTVVVPVQQVHRGVWQALQYACSLSDNVRAVYVEVDPAETEAVRQTWAALETPVPLEVLQSPYRSYVAILVEYIERVNSEQKEAVLTVVLPEFVPPHWWQQALHNGNTIWLKAALLYHPDIVVTSVPFVLH